MRHWIVRRGRQWTRRGALAGALLGVVAILGACGEDNGMTPVDEPATIVATVTADDTAASGVSVNLFEDGAMSALSSATTDASGQVLFEGLDAGSYDVAITIPSGLTLEDGPARRAVTATAGQEATVSFALATETAPATDTVEVTLTNYAFSPDELTIAPGTLVRWVNNTSTFHTITPDGHNEWNEGSVSSQGEEFTHTFMNEGTFPYYCSPHQSLGMVGTITVQSQ